jgi:hypothetical protein
MPSSLRTLIIGIIAILMTVGIWGCDEDSTSEPAQQSLRDFINSIGTFSSPPAEFDQAVGTSDTTISGSGGIEVCTFEKFEMGRNPEEVVAFSPNDVALWPGCIVQGQHLSDGILVPVSALRAPCTVGIDLPGLSAEERSADIENPTQFNVNGALDAIVDTFLARGFSKDAQFTFISKETYEFEQGLLDIGISAEWPSGNLRSQFGYSWTSQEHTLLLKFVQKYYVATVNPPVSPTAFFDASVTPDDLDNYTGPGNPLCYVQSVTYGRLGILSMTSTESQSMMTAALNAAFNSLFVSGTIDVSTEHEQVLQESTMKLLILGGQGTSAVQNLTDPIAGLLNWISAGIELAPETRGVPISYTVAHLKDNSMARFQYTTEFTRRLCAFADQPLWISVHQLKCEGSEGGFYPALEGWWDVWLTTEIPGLDPIEKHAHGTFADFDPGETRAISTAAWDNPIPSQAGVTVTLRIRIIEDDDTYDDNMGDYSWVLEYPDFNPGTGTCTGDPERCDFNQLFHNGDQKIRAYWKLHLDGNP